MESKKENSLAKLTAIYMLGNFSSKAISFLLVFALTYFLNPSQIGAYDLILTSASLLVPMVTLQIDSAVLRWMVDTASPYTSDYLLKNVFTLLFFNILISFLVYLVAQLFLESQYSSYAFALIVFQSLIPTLQQSLRGRGKNMLFALSGVVFSFLYVSTSLLFLIFTDLGVEGVLLGNIVANAILATFIIIKEKYYSLFSFTIPDTALLRKLVQYSLPLLPNSISWWMVGSSTRYVILFYLGVNANGIFAISYKYPTIILMLSNVFNLAWQESALKPSDPTVQSKTAGETLKKYISFLFGIIILLSSSSRYLITKIVETDFSESWRYMPILLFAVCLQALSAFYGVSYLKSRRTMGAFSSSVVGAAITVSSSFILTWKYGLFGTSSAILLGYGCMLLLRIKQSKSLFEIPFPWVYFLSLTGLYIILNIGNYLSNDIMSYLSIFISLIVSVNLNKSQIQTIKKKYIR